jgi:hypothetical protein
MGVPIDHSRQYEPTLGLERRLVWLAAQPWANLGDEVPSNTHVLAREHGVRSRDEAVADEHALPSIPKTVDP